MQCIPRATSEQLLPAPTSYVINKQNGGEICKFIITDFRAFCLKKYTIGRGYASKSKI